MDNVNTNNKDRFISLTPAVEQATKVLKYLASESRFKTNLTDISKKVGINKSKVYAILTALQHAGFVSKDAETKLYSLGLDIIPIGQKALENINYRKIAQPFLEKLARATACTVLFGLITRDRFFLISKEASGSEIDSRLDVGYTLELFFKSHGKAILAAMPEKEVDHLLSGKKFFNEFEKGIIDNSQLSQIIAETKKRGFALDSGRLSSMVKVLSSAVLGHDDYPIGAIIVMGIMKKSDVSKYAAKLIETAKNLSLMLGASN